MKNLCDECKCKIKDPVGISMKTRHSEAECIFCSVECIIEFFKSVKKIQDHFYENTN